MKGPAKLTKMQVFGLRLDIALRKTSPREVAAKYGLSTETVRKAERGETFRDVPTAEEFIDCVKKVGTETAALIFAAKLRGTQNDPQ